MHSNIFAKYVIVHVWQGFENVRVLNMSKLRSVTSMSKYVWKILNMPKYTLICHNKKRSKYFGILNMSDAVAYCIYPSIFRHLQCSEPEAYSEPCQSLWLSVSFKIPCNPSIHRTLEYSGLEPFSEPWFFYSEACGWYTKDRLVKIIVKK